MATVQRVYSKWKENKRTRNTCKLLWHFLFNCLHYPTISYQLNFEWMCCVARDTEHRQEVDQGATPRHIGDRSKSEPYPTLSIR